MAERRLSDIDLAFELKKSGRTVAEIADAIGVSSRTIFNWFAEKKPIKPVTTPPGDFATAIEMLGKAAGIEVAVALDTAKSGRGATERIWRLARSLAIIRALAEIEPGIEDQSPEMNKLKVKIARRIEDIAARKRSAQ